LSEKLMNFCVGSTLSSSRDSGKRNGMNRRKFFE
jgi:hypothetical protein